MSFKWKFETDKKSVFMLQEMNDEVKLKATEA